MLHHLPKTGAIVPYEYIFIVTTAGEDSFTIGAFTSEERAKEAQKQTRVRTFIEKVNKNEIRPLPKFF